MEPIRFPRLHLFLDAIFVTGGRILTKLAAQIHSWECKKSCVDFGDRDLIFKVELSIFAS